MRASLATGDAGDVSIFSDVDGHEAPDSAARYLHQISSVSSIEHGKRARDAMLGLGLGSSVLDVGCGLGIDVRRMAAIVGASGRAVGVDLSRELLARAAELPGGEFVEWCQADACQLPHPDDEFDAVRIERTLEHLNDPSAAVAEAIRVARPGGVVCLCEPDWGTLVVGGLSRESSDSVREVMSQTVRNPFLGRDLLAIVRGAGVTKSVQVHGEVVTVRDAPTVEELAQLSRPLSDAETADLRTAGDRGGLIAMLTLVTVLARR